MQQVVVGRAVGEVRRLAVLATAHRLAGEEHRAGRAMVGAEVGVLRYATAEFGKGHEHHVIGPADALHVAHKAGDRVRHIGQQPLVRIDLVNVGIERVVAVGHVVQPRRHVGSDECGDLR